MSEPAVANSIVENVYKYDVAFSFLAEDEKIAAQLNALLKPHLATFYYSEKQKEIAGRDGEQAFNEVFAKEARVVVILYREKMGNYTMDTY